MGKIFVRERIRTGRGAGRPRFVVVAVEGADLKVYIPRLRKVELEKLAEEIEAQIVYLPRGEQAGEEGEEGAGKARRKRDKKMKQG
jgi:hypothetical protein